VLSVSGGAAPARLRIVGLVEGDPAAALSGVAHRLLSALARHVTVAGCIDYQPGGAARLALAAGTYRRDRGHWRARYHTSPLAHRVLSQALARRVKGFEGPFDLALQIHGWVAGQPRPYVLYVDQTRLMAERGWPQWMPLPARERAQILELERRMYEGAAHVLTMGEPARESLRGDYAIAEDQITVVGGGLMFDALPSPAISLTSEPTILFVGREFERKGGDCLLQAFALVREQVPEARLMLVGVERPITTPGVSCLRRVARREELSELYRRSRVFCLPTHYEPYGFVFAEAMAHGLPCVGTSVQSVPSILDDGRAGLLVAPGDVHGLADALLRLLSDPELATRIARAGRTRVERCLLWDHVAARALPALQRAAARA
jgi:alpha-maltose-1-phosphate synthase